MKNVKAMLIGLGMVCVTVVVSVGIVTKNNEHKQAAVASIETPIVSPTAEATEEPTITEVPRFKQTELSMTKEYRDKVDLFIKETKNELSKNGLEISDYYKVYYSEESNAIIVSFCMNDFYNIGELAKQDQRFEKAWHELTAEIDDMCSRYQSKIDSYGLEGCTAMVEIMSDKGGTKALYQGYLGTNQCDVAE